MGASACVLGLLGLSGLLTGAALHAYRNLVWEQPVAIVDIRGREDGSWELRLEQAPPGPVDVYRLTGVEWQLDARVLRWRGPASALGLRPRYRVERLSSRWPAASGSAPIVIDLASEAPPFAWRWLRELDRFLPWVDSIYGSATYMPLADGARFEVLMTRGGLLARAGNEAARTSVRDW